MTDEAKEREADEVKKREADEAKKREADEAKKREAVTQTSQGAGAFEIKLSVDDDNEFNLEPKDLPGPIPEDQREIELGIYKAWGILKLLREQGVFAKDDGSFNEFRRRLLEVARVGLAANHVKTILAAKALEQIRDEISVRKGVTIKLTYLVRLAGWAVLGVIVGGVVIFLSKQGLPGLAGYGWVVIGSMAGAWMSVAASRRTVTFEEMPNFLGFYFEPLIRLWFVGLLATTFALFLQLGVLTLRISAVDFAEFPSKIGVALVLGVVAGISEKAVSVRIIERTRKLFTSGSS